MEILSEIKNYQKTQPVFFPPPFPPSFGMTQALQPLVPIPSPSISEFSNFSIPGPDVITLTQKEGSDVKNRADCQSGKQGMIVADSDDGQKSTGLSNNSIGKTAKRKRRNRKRNNSEKKSGSNEYSGKVIQSFYVSSSCSYQTVVESDENVVYRPDF